MINALHIMEFKYMNTYKTSDLIRLYTCKSKLVSMATKTGLLRNRKPTLAEVLVYAVIKMKEKKINASSATIIYILTPYFTWIHTFVRAAAGSMQGGRFSYSFLTFIFRKICKIKVSYKIFCQTHWDIDCVYLLEPPQWGSSNTYPKSIFWKQPREINQLKIVIFKAEIRCVDVLSDESLSLSLSLSL